MDKQAEPNTLCVCGRLNSAARGGGILVFIQEAEVHLLEALLLGAFENVPCDNCGRLLNVRPSVVFICQDPQVCWFALGSQVKSHREEISAQLATRSTALKSKLKEVPSLQALRAAVVEIQIGRLGAVKDLMDAILQNRVAEHSRANLAALSAKTFATAYLACKVPQFRLKVKRPDDSEVLVDELLERFGKAQATTWLMLWSAWSNGEEPGPTLEEDLSRYIQKDSFLPSAVETALKSFAELASVQDLPVLASYCLEAIRASLYAAEGQPNPDAKAWASRLFQLEISLSLIADDDERESTTRLLVSPERARATVTFNSAWDAVVPYLQDSGRPIEPDVYKALSKVAKKVGHPYLLGQIQSSAMIQYRDLPSSTDIIELLNGISTTAKSADELMVVVRLLTGPLVKPGGIEELAKVGAAIIKLLGEGHEAEAAVDSWLGSCCLKLRLPQWFLTRVGEKPREWEHGLSPSSRCELWIERSNALRLLGRSVEALGVVEEVLHLFPDDGSVIDRRVAERNRAILLRDVGAHDASLEALERLLPDTFGEERLQTLDSLAMTLSQVGRFEDMSRIYDEASREARGPWAGLSSTFQAKKAMALSAVGRNEEAIAVLSGLTGNLEAQALFGVASAWANVLQEEVKLPDGADKWVEAVITQLRSCAESAEAREDFQALMAALRLLAFLTGVRQPEEAEALWISVEAAANRHGQPLAALDLLELAAYAYRRGKSAEARRHLLRIPGALAVETGATADLWMASQGQVRKLRAGLNRVTPLALEQGRSFADARLIAEMRRDVIGRAQSLRRQPADAGLRWLKHGLGDNIVSQLAPASGHLAVIEWVETSTWIAGLVTVIGADGNVSSQWLEPPDIEIGVLAANLRNRLRDWRPGRRGDPLDRPDWWALEKWLTSALSSHFPGDGHVVFLESQRHAGLPWHVAARRWPASYATSWTSMLSLRFKPVLNDSHRVGIVLVPRFNETDDVLQMLRSSAERTRKFAEVSGFALLQEEDERRCDHQAFRRIMADSTVAKFLCHGFENPREREVALMLAHDGLLPLALEVASNSPAGCFHHLGWQQCRDLPTAPAVVFSAACSSGTSHLVGLGERLGLFAGLRRAGARSLVAPRWDLFAESVLPILDDVLERYLTGETVAKALHASCLAAEHRLPTWLAWTLMLEGDWR
jgi:tetratricopeptide (TPR) repeat protein